MCILLKCQKCTDECQIKLCKSFCKTFDPCFLITYQECVMTALQRCPKFETRTSKYKLCADCVAETINYLSTNPFIIKPMY
jgi:hypothetical protein